MKKKQTPISQVIEKLEDRIKQLNIADSKFCEDRWNMDKPSFIRSAAREASNEVHGRRRELEDQVKVLKSILPYEEENLKEAYRDGFLMKSPVIKGVKMNDPKLWFQHKYKTNE